MISARKNSSQQMKLLVISPTPTSPADQGNRQRVKQLCEALKARGAEVHFGYFPREWGGKFSPNEQREMTQEWDFCDTIVPSKPFVYTTNDTHFGIDDWWDDAIGRYIHYKTSGVRFDACIVNYAFFSKAFESLPSGVVKILDTHDRLSGRRELLENHGVNPEFFYTSEAQEKIALDRADLVIAINEDEAAFFRTLTERTVMVLGHVAERKSVTPIRRLARAPYRMGFLGSANSVNVKNMNDFLTNLAATRPDGLPGIEINIYGSCSSRIDVPANCGTPVRIVGKVKDVEEFYANVDCVFVPFLFGTGQKIKLIEALAFGLPVISTLNASEGLGSDEPVHCLESFNEVIDAMAEFAGQPKFRKSVLLASSAQFNRYAMQINESLNALYELAHVNSVYVSINRDDVFRRFVNKGRQELVAAGVQLISVLDMLSWKFQIEEKDRAVEAIRDGLSDAAEHSATQPEQLRKIDVGSAFPAQQLGTHIIFEGINSGGAHGIIDIRVRLPILGASAEKDEPDEGSGLDISLNGAAKPWRANSIVLSTPTSPLHRFEKRFEQIVVLTTDCLSAEARQLASTITSISMLRRNLRIPIIAIDLEGRQAKWDGTIFELESGPISPVETLISARASVLSMRSAGVLHGFLHSECGSLFRVLANDCGPVVSYVSPDHRGVLAEGEILSRSSREVASWLVHCHAAPRWAAQIASQRRLSVESMESMGVNSEIVLRKIQKLRSEWAAHRISRLKEKGLALQLEAKKKSGGRR
jgi:glycosyltransferase involved in cell wall biosynthesis